MRGRRAWILLAVAAAALIYGCFLWWPRTVDDSYIIYHYAQNLADGLGPVYHPEERVEGYSSPTWVMLMAAAVGIGLDPVPVSKILGFACALALIFLLDSSLRRAGVTPLGAGLAALLLGSNFVLQIWSVAGLETSAYALLFFAGLVQLTARDLTPRQALIASILLAAAALTRPEGLAYWGLGLVVTAASLQGAARIRGLLWYAMPGLVLVFHFVWRFLYYGSWLPNTYYVKTGGGPEMWRQGLVGLVGFASRPSHLLWLLAAVFGAVAAILWKQQRRSVLLLGGVTILHLLYVVQVGDDGLYVHRFFVPVLAPLAFLFGLSFLGDSEGRVRSRVLSVLGILVCLVSAPLSLATLRFQAVPLMVSKGLPYDEGNVKLGRHLAENRPEDTEIAVSAAGALAYYSRLPTIDMYGLNDHHIARQPFPRARGARMMKFDNEYVLSRKPDLIVINRGFFRAGDTRAERVLGDPRGMLVASPLDHDLFNRIDADGSYELRPIRMDDGSVYFVFERR